MWKKVLIGLAVVVGVFVAVIALQPSEYHVERTITITAPPAFVWAEVSDFDRWKKWSHWEKSDPSQKTTVTGEPGSVGHKTEWAGEKTGKGSMTIAEATKPTHLHIKLVFTEPMASEATTDLKLEPNGNVVGVTWSMDGHNNFVGKFFGLVMGMEGMIGQAYETSLADLKQVAEASAKEAKEKAAAEAAAAKAKQDDAQDAGAAGDATAAGDAGDGGGGAGTAADAGGAPSAAGSAPNAPDAASP
jgi:hypothetical protein